MKKILVLLIVLVIGAAAVFIFRSNITNFLMEKKDVAIEYAVKKLAEKYPIPDKVQQDIINISKKADPKMLGEFLKDPKSFTQGGSQKAMEFMKTDEGKKLLEYFNTYMKEKK